ncbi:hypothetical protein [Archangium sp.]|jgi:hypothetical protein|uniref:hypothetical protein n=1 Tax=Archangium sp. TaxID=1872627 RepID=UPI002EDA5403
MALYELTPTAITPLSETTFAESGVLERRDLQRLLRDAIEVLSPETLVITEEFGDWEDSHRRIDLLGLDRSANLVVIELKRTEDGGHMELQALRYAAMVSAMTFSKLVEVHSDYLARIGRAGEDAKQRVLDFLGWDEPEEESFAADVKVLLASADFSKELTTTVMWLNERDLDIRCVRLRPYRFKDKLLLDVQQLIPLPEADAYQVQLREKATERRQSRRQEGGPDFTRYDLFCAGQRHPNQWKRNMVYAVVRAAIERKIPIAELPVPRGKWLVVSGNCATKAEFEAKLQVEPEAGTRAYHPRRWFNADDQLLRAEGKTYCLSNQWGDTTFPVIDGIAARFPELGIRYERSAGQEE